MDALRKRKSHYRETKVRRLIIIIIGVSLRAARMARGGNAGDDRREESKTRGGEGKRAR